MDRPCYSNESVELIDADPAKGFYTIVGERGIRLSCGQRQRIGLAQALYHRPQVLILDEPRSSPDLQTDSAVIKSINALQGTVPIIAIAHRLSTLERCDRTNHLVRKSSPDLSKEKP
jgi:ABC-type bacteriocin/lantibiotic exporter with double-glycine peptidase domain